MKHTMMQVYLLSGALFAVIIFLIFFASSPNHNVKVASAPDTKAVAPKASFSKDKETPW